MISAAQALNCSSTEPGFEALKLPSKTEHSVLKIGKNILVPRGIGVSHVRTSPVCPLVPVPLFISPAVPAKKSRFPGCLPRSHNAPVASLKGLPTLVVSIERAQFHH